MVKIKQLLIVLTIILLINPISFAQVIVAEGTLVDESFIEIENSDDLANIKEDLTKDYKLTKDIDLKDVKWEPIDAGEFTGALIGDDFTVQNMPAQYLEDESFGLFTEVKDLENIDVDIKFAAEEIENSKELANIQDDLTRDYILIKDIDLKEAEWEPIDQGEFTGTLTGDDFIIQNMPTKYLEDENFGLFTEVEDLDNIDVEIEFAAKEIEKAAEKESEEIEQQEKNDKKDESIVEDSFIEIENSEDLANIKEDLTEDYILTQNIDLKDAEWEAIQGAFTGTLTGEDFIIQNMPAQYSEDENFGLFTEVEDIENIDVKVKCAKEIKELQDKKETVKEKTDESHAKGEVLEKTIGTMADDKPVTVTVRSHSELKDELNKSNAEVINLGEPYKVDSFNFRSNDANILKIESRSKNLVINGYGNEIKQDGTLKRDMIQVINPDKDIEITFKNIKLTSANNNAIVKQTNGSKPWKLVFDKVDATVKNPENAYPLINVEGDVELSGITNLTSEKTIWNAKSVTVTPEADVEVTTPDLFYESLQVEAELRVEGNLTINATKQKVDKSLIDLSGDKSKIIVGGISNQDDSDSYSVNPNFTITSERTTKEPKDNRAKVGLIKLSGKNKAEFRVINGAKVEISQTSGTILFIDSIGGQVNIKGPETEVNFILEKKGIGEEYKDDAVIHFHEARVDEVASALKYELNILDQAKLEVLKKSGTAPAIRVGTGKQHKINVEENSTLIVHNGGSGKVQDPSQDTSLSFRLRGVNQAIFFNSIYADKEDLPKFNLKTGSTAKLTADSGGAMHMSGGGDINVGEDTTFTAEGETATKEAGIIDTGGPLVDGYGDKESVITMNSPASFDLKNNNRNGRVFRTGKNSEFKGTTTDLEVWKRVNDTDEYPLLPDDSWFGVDEYNFDGLDFINKKESSSENEIGRLNVYSRIKGTKSGELKLESFPANLKFTAKIKSKTEEYLMDQIPDDDKHLIISDTRKNREYWELRAKISNDSNMQFPKELTLNYRDGDRNIELNDKDEVVKSHDYVENPTDEKTFNLSEEWIQDNEGMFIRVEQGIMNKDYTGKVTWTLSDAP